MAVVRIFAMQKVPTDPTPWGVVSQGTGGAGNSALQKFPSADGEIFRWRRSREAIRGFGTNPFLLWANSAKQICGGEKFRKTEFREASASFFAPAASKKSNKQALLCNFYLMRLLSATCSPVATGEIPPFGGEPAKRFANHRSDFIAIVIFYIADVFLLCKASCQAK